MDGLLPAHYTTEYKYHKVITDIYKQYTFGAQMQQEKERTVM